jgi:drug/metabolite transporter (DMT)-like permease
MHQENKPLLLDWMVLFALMLVWGSSFILIKKSLIGFDNLQVGALRISISFLALLPLAIRRLARIKKKNFYLFLIAGLLGNAIPAFLFAKAQTGLDSYMAGILNSLTPLFTLIFGVWLFGRRTVWLNVAGVIAGFAGAAGLLYSAGGGSIELNLIPALFVVIATICYALQMHFVKNYLTGYDPITIASLAFVFIGIPSMIFLFVGTDFFYRMNHGESSWKSLGYVSLLSVFGTALAIMASFWLLKRTSALFTSSVTYLMPVVSIGWGVFDSEPFLFSYILWIAIILVGVYMANLPANGFVRSMKFNKKFIPGNDTDNQR